MAAERLDLVASGHFRLGKKRPIRSGLLTDISGQRTLSASLHPHSLYGRIRTDDFVP